MATEWVNPKCLVNCKGCNAYLCCWDMAREDFEEGRQCDCAIYDEVDGNAEWLAELKRNTGVGV